MKTLRRVLVVAGVAIVVGAGFGAAVRADQAGKGRPGRERLKQRLMERHPEADTNADGSLSRDEVVEFLADHPQIKQRRQQMRGRFGRMRQALRERAQQVLQENPDADLNDNGKLDPTEAREFFKAHSGAFGQRLLQRRPELDADGDGLLSFDEARAGMLKRFPKLDADGNGTLSDQEVDSARQRMKERRRTNLLERFPQVDTDGDGALSDAEVQAAVQARFSPAGGE